MLFPEVPGGVQEFVLMTGRSSAERERHLVGDNFVEPVGGDKSERRTKGTRVMEEAKARDWASKTTHRRNKTFGWDGGEDEAN